ncbi:ABC transporter permease [Pyrococcus furiosus DSM 3638]|uniref:Ribose ABC transporter n=3 Tax=Pyrococcus furiosus TaxID=2261 RepID=Q8U0A1_PYRFU|nr:MULTISPECIES: ABC transporter permease [Pyrococcus]AAL81822.1 putative ribose ABC transporter [Pyrococcus furiosus DSM 3638]AFN04942.1 ribose ABC transporter [Pyrococcus furiosus COM1]MDK2868977.1 ral nucleoside transport system permease protein [Pyrococcus sp.]QEK79315.1 ABC transporter permease [Pyrococcus furiosus DSM 3638]
MLEDVFVLLSNTLFSMVPLVLAGVGEVITERSGVVNIGLEGIFILSAFLTTVVTFYTENPYLGLIIGILVGALSGLLHGIISVYLKGDQIIAGVGFNSLAYGISILSLVALWHSHGSSPSVEKMPVIIIGHLTIPPMAIVAILVGVITWWWLYKTPSGLKLRACGEDPRAAEAMGVNVHRTRLYATMVGGALTGLGGAYLVVGWIGQFTKFISAGRGFIALANVAFSNWNPLMAVVGGIIFGFFDALSIYVPIKIQKTTGRIITAESNLFRIIPYIGTLLVVTIIMKKVKAPRALGKPYIKE